jgi:molybdate transport system regulatory protein
MTKSPQIVVRFRVDLSRNCSIGIGKIELLEAIIRTGSISKAAREIGMSYRRAWLLVEDMKVNLDEAVVESNTGGVRGGGASVTAFGKQMIASYRRLESDFQGLANVHLGNLASHAKLNTGWPLVSTVSTKRKLKTKDVE